VFSSLKVEKFNCLDKNHQQYRLYVNKVFIECWSHQSEPTTNEKENLLEILDKIKGLVDLEQLS
jgi:hypothetical protein